MVNRSPTVKRPVSIRGPTARERQGIRLLAEWRRSRLEGSVFCRIPELPYSAFRFWTSSGGGPEGDPNLPYSAPPRPASPMNW
jgi:hypothetical protein